MATATRHFTCADHGQRMSFAEFVDGDLEGVPHLDELARGVIVVTEVPGPNHGRVVMKLGALFVHDDDDHPGVIHYRAGRAES